MSRLDRVLAGITAVIMVCALAMGVWMTYADFRADRACWRAGYISGSAHVNGDAECLVERRTVRIAR